MVNELRAYDTSGVLLHTFTGHSIDFVTPYGIQTLDEVRLGSDSTKTDTDSDGVSDFQELSFSNWLVEGWGETYCGEMIFPNLYDVDTDHDNLRDNVDPYPCYRIEFI